MMNEIQVGEAEKEEEEKSLSEQLRTVADHVEDLQEVRLTMLLTMLALYVTGHVPPPADHVGLVRYRLHHHCRHLLQLATVVHVLEGS